MFVIRTVHGGSKTRINETGLNGSTWNNKKCKMCNNLLIVYEKCIINACNIRDILNGNMNVAFEGSWCHVVNVS